MNENDSNPDEFDPRYPGLPPAALIIRNHGKRIGSRGCVCAECEAHDRGFWLGYTVGQEATQTGEMRKCFGIWVTDADGKNGRWISDRDNGKDMWSGSEADAEHAVDVRRAVYGRTRYEVKQLISCTTGRAKTGGSGE